MCGLPHMRFGKRKHFVVADAAVGKGKGECDQLVVSGGKRNAVQGEGGKVGKQTDALVAVGKGVV